MVLDEAFVLLSIRNTWDVLQKEIKDNKDDKDEGHSKSSIYAQGKCTNQGTNLRYGSWSPKGINWFNELYDLGEKTARNHGQRRWRRK
jgi:hypothetical protein